MWFVRFRGKTSGPFAEDRLKSMIQLNQFSALHQVSTDGLSWESAAALVQRLNGATSTADKWKLAATLRQAERSEEGGGFVPAGDTPRPQSRKSAARKPATSDVAVGSVSVNVDHASKAVTDRSTGGVRVLLHPTTLRLYIGELTAVIGPSGSGKSTLLGLLTGRAQPTNGKVTVFGRDLTRDFETVKRSLSVVPQHDAFLTSLRVSVSLYYSACLRLPETTSSVQLVQHVQGVLRQVGLEECAERRISQLSGGQLRRLSLAQELLSDPKVLYLDEVTSGLDEQSDADIMALLRTLSAGGRTIVIITHHLHNLQANCHKLLVLAAGGFLVYYGSPEEACRAFQVTKATEVLPVVKALKPDEVQSRCDDARNESEASRPNVANSLPPAFSAAKPGGRHLHDFGVLVKRQLTLLVSSPLSTLMSVMICVVIGVLLMSSYRDLTAPKEPVVPTKKFVEQQMTNVRDSSSNVFVLAISAYFLGCLAGTRELVMERRLFWRESGTGMSLPSYLGSKLLVHAVLTSIQAGCLGAAVVIVVKADCSPAQVALANVAVSMSGLATGLFISAASKSDAVATKMMLLAILPQIILAGALKKDPPEAIKLMSQLFITSHYAFHYMCSLFKTDLEFTPKYSAGIVVAVAALHSAIFLGGTLFFLQRTARGEDPARGE